jgi:signal transduction histidine kinase
MGLRLRSNWSSRLSHAFALILATGLALFSFFELASMEHHHLAADWDVRKALIYSNLKGLSASIQSSNHLMRDENIRPLFRDPTLREAIVIGPPFKVLGGFSLLDRKDDDVLLLPASGGDEPKLAIHRKFLEHEEIEDQYFGEVDEWGLFQKQQSPNGHELLISAPLLGPKVNNQRIRLATLSLRYDLTEVYSAIHQAQLRFVGFLFGFAFLLFVGVRWALRSVEENMNLRIENEGLVARRQLMEVFAHDVRKPFQMIRTLREAMKNDLTPSEIKDLIHQFNKELDVGVKNVQSMIEDTLELASGRELNLEFLSLKELIQEASQSVIERHPRLGSRIHWNLQFADRVQWDRSRINRVLWNLFENAAQAMSTQSEIFVGTRLLPENGVEISIRNTGAEIASEDLAKIFKAGFTKGRQRGTGLGLSIVRDLVERHGGLVVASSDPVRGVEFTIQLPRILRAESERQNVS